MADEQNRIHTTRTATIWGVGYEGWEIYCSECSYRARLIYYQGYPGSELEILDYGDLTVRHRNNHIQESDPWDEYALESSLEEENWLTPELRAQVEAILKRAWVEDY